MDIIEEHLAAIRTTLFVLVWVIIGVTCIIINLWVLGLLIIIITFVVWWVTDAESYRKKKDKKDGQKTE